jgi:tetratricopeptide (TPR) repeat protein
MDLLRITLLSLSMARSSTKSLASGSQQRPASPLRQRLAWVAAIVATLAAAWLLWGHWSAWRHWNQGERAAEKRDFAAAVEHFRAYAATYPASAQGRFQLARTLRRAEQYAEASDLLQSCDWIPELVELEKTLLIVQQRGTRGPAREVVLSCVSTHHADEPLALEAAVIGDRRVLDLQQVGVWLNFWIEDFPADWIARQWRGELRESSKHFAEARQDYLKALELQPGRVELLQKLGGLELADAAGYAQAEPYFRQVVEKDPASAAGWLGIARCRQGLGDPQEAIAAAKRAVELQPRLGAALLLLAEVAVEADHQEEALKWLQQAERTEADQEKLQHLFVQVFRRMGKIDEAAVHDELLQRYKQADEQLDKVLALALKEPDQPQHQHDLGLIYRQLNKDQLAEQWFLGALQRDPNFAPSHEALADLYSRSSDPRMRAQADGHRRLAEKAKKKDD